MTSSDPADISNLFIEYFTNITSSVQLRHLPESRNRNYLTNFVLPAGSDHFSIPPITELEDSVFSSVSRLPSNKAVGGLDGISGFFLKMSASAISSSITSILSLSCGIFPDIW